MSIALRFISAVLAENSVGSFLEHGPMQHMFSGASAGVYEFVREFVHKYQKLPSVETVESATGVTLLEFKEPAAFYRDILELSHIEDSIKRMTAEAREHLLPGKKNEQKSLEVLTTGLMELTTQRFSKKIVDFRDCYDTLMVAYKDKWKQGDDYGLQFGWPTLDKVSGGVGKGDVVSLVGRPGLGKTMFMLHGAMHGWKSKPTEDTGDVNRSRLFVSMEMDSLPIQQRLAGLYTQLPVTKIKNAAFGDAGFSTFQDTLGTVKGQAAPFYVVDGNLAATVEDIYAIASQLQPGAIFIDGAYLVQHPQERDRFKRVAENADLIKKRLAPIAPVVASWQFAKTAAKKKKDEKVGLEDIGYTDAIAQVSSIALGLSEDDSIETVIRRKIDIMKGRSGETGSFHVNWDWDKMNFGELEKIDLSELEIK